MRWTEFLRSPNGGVEINRLVGFFGGFVYVIAANIFVGYEVLWLGKAFDVTAYCLAFPAGLATVVTGTAAAVALKDRNVASAQVIQETGVVPSKDTSATIPAKVEVVNTPDNPANVTETSSAELPDYAR